MKPNPANQLKRPQSLRHSPRREGLALTAFVCAAGGAAAQEPTAEAKPVANTDGTLPEHVVEGESYDTLYQAERLQTPKFTQPLRDVPQTITVIPEALYEDQGATTLRDVLRNVPGITLQAGEGGVSSGDNLTIRGFNARTDIFIDGIRDFGSYGRDPFNLEQVEVYKGPSSSNGGRGSTGGSLNLVSKTAKLEDFVHTDISFGSDELKRGTLDINKPIDGIEGSALRLNTMWHENMVAGRDEVENQRFGVAASLGFGLGEQVIGETTDASGKSTLPLTAPSDTRLWLNFFHFEEDNQPDFGIPWVPATVTDPRLVHHIDKAAPVPFNNYYGSVARDFEDISTTMGTIQFEHDINDSITIRDQFRVGTTERYSIMSAPRFTGVGSMLNRNPQSRDEVTDIIANQTDFQLSFDTGSIGHEAVIGFEFVRETNERFLLTNPTVPQTDLFAPNPFDGVSGTLARNGARNDSDSFSASVYAFETAEITDWLELTGGVRWDRFDLDYTSINAAGAATFLNRVDELASGRAAVVFKPVEYGSIYFGYGTSFNPVGEGLSLSDSPTATTSLLVDPEKNESFEIGTKWDLLDERLTVTAALFRTDKTNARTIDPTDPDAVVVLEGEQRVQGFELGVAGDITPWWHVFGGYVHLDSEILTSNNATEIGNELPYTPQNSFNFWTQIDLPGGFFVGGGPQFLDSRFNNTANLREAPAYWLWDAVAGYEVNENLTLRVNVHNVADEDYIDRIGGGHFIPGAGRSVMFTASLKF